jgi:hypothetical protein
VFENTIDRAEMCGRGASPATMKLSVRAQPWEVPVIDSLLNLLFRCSHHRLTRPLTPASPKGVPQGKTYVVCLDCGKQFTYDLEEMRIGKPVDHPNQRSKVKYALLATVSMAMLISAVCKIRKPSALTRP